MRDTAEEVKTNLYAMYFCGPRHMDEQRLDNQIEAILYRYRMLSGKPPGSDGR